MAEVCVWIPIEYNTVMYVMAIIAVGIHTGSLWWEYRDTKPNRLSGFHFCVLAASSLMRRGGTWQPGWEQ